MKKNNTELVLNELLFDNIKPNHLEDVEWLMKYLKKGNKNKAPLFLSLGESWSEMPTKLLNKLKKAPLYTHGYQLSMYGLPKLRKTITKYIQTTQQIPSSGIGTLYEIAVTWTGTRNSMFDFGRVLLDEYFYGKEPILITTAPGWDYQGVFEPLGFKTKFIQLNKENKFFPTMGKIKKTITGVDSKALVVINAQHNPTSINWPRDIIENLIDLCIEKSYAILIDDALFGVHNTSTKPTSTLRILFEKLNKTNIQIPWIAVRSFGKEFAVNGWGIGAIVSNPSLLDKFVNKYRTTHIYNYGGPFQYALSEWINSEDSKKYTKARSKSIQKNKEMIKKAFCNNFGYKESDIYEGECTSFMLFDIPNKFDNVKDFLRECFEKTGILLSDAWPKPYNTTNDMGIRCARIYVDSDKEVYSEMIKRLKNSKFHFEMNNFI